jgi:hypothetical protein
VWAKNFGHWKVISRSKFFIVKGRRKTFFLKLVSFLIKKKNPGSLGKALFIDGPDSD